MKTTNTKGHLTSFERDKLTVLHSQGLSIRKIANILERSPSTISRELKRKEAVFYRGKYIGSQTHLNVKKLWAQKHIRERIKDKNIKRFIKENLKYGYSPEIISASLKRKYGISIHHETIYRYIYKTNSKLNLSQYLLRRKIGRKPRKKVLFKPMKSLIPNRTDISLRPQEINERKELGHFECDSIESGKIRGKQLPCLTVLVDRASRKTIIMKTASKTSKQTTKSILNALKPYLNTVKSITYDNGMEFSMHQKINNTLNIKSYFCRPYHSWEKGTVENINGIIRRFFPKKVNFDTISEEQIAFVEDWINNRPMKILNYMTPNEKFQELSVAIA